VKPKKSAKQNTKPQPARRDTEQVGYGRPPQQHQFQAGQSGNPRGRPKGAKNQATILHKILHRKLAIRDRGRTRNVPLIEAMLLKFAEEALRGNPKAAAFLLNRYGPAEQEGAAETELSRDDQEILDAFAHRIKKQFTTEEN